MTGISATARMARERRFYLGMAIAMIAIVLLGFGPSFYFKGLWSWPRPNPVLSPFVMFHGLMFSAWMLLFATQAGLVSANRRDLHMKLGRLGMAFALVLIPVMYLTAVFEVARANQPPVTTPLGWTVVPLLLIPAYAVLIWLGWKHRRNPQAHKRLMLGAAILMMDPAIGRIPLAPPTLAGVAIGNALSWAMFVPLFVHDLRQPGGRLHWATVTGAALFAAALIARISFLSQPGLWDGFAARLPGV